MKINEEIKNSEYCGYRVIEDEDRPRMKIYRDDLRPGNQFSNPPEAHFEYRKTKFECQELWNLLMRVYDAGYNNGFRDGEKRIKTDLRHLLGLWR